MATTMHLFVWLGALFLIVQEANTLPTTYPVDDYFSPVNFSLAVPVTLDDLLFVNFDHRGVEVLPGELQNYPTKIFIHGWTTSILKSPWYPPLKEAYLNETEPINVIYAEYEGPASLKYTVASATALNVGKVMAEYLMATKVHMDSIHLIGHSLGSHVAAFTGRHVFNVTGRKVGRITLLDPAGPKFDKTPERACPDDGQFVDVIHTDDGHYGSILLTGHVDLFPNGGVKQPGCPSIIIDDNCSHARSTKFFIESVASRPKVAYAAESWEDFKDENYTDPNPQVFGEYISHAARGKYYLTTEAEPPYFG